MKWDREIVKTTAERAREQLTLTSEAAFNGGGADQGGEYQGSAIHADGHAPGRGGAADPSAGKPSGY